MISIYELDHDKFYFAKHVGIPITAESFQYYFKDINYNNIGQILGDNYNMFLTGTTFKILCFKKRHDAELALDYINSILILNKLGEN